MQVKCRVIGLSEISFFIVSIYRDCKLDVFFLYLFICKIHPISHSFINFRADNLP